MGIRFIKAPTVKDVRLQIAPAPVRQGFSAASAITSGMCGGMVDQVNAIQMGSSLIFMLLSITLRLRSAIILFNLPGWNGPCVAL